MIKDVAASFEMQCQTKKIIFDLTFSGASLEVYADFSKIQQVLYNLIDNAIKFSNENSTIFISSFQRHDRIFVSIKDNGVGVPKKDLKKIFDRFYKSDASRGKDKKAVVWDFPLSKRFYRLMKVASMSSVPKDLAQSLYFRYQLQ